MSLSIKFYCLQEIVLKVALIDRKESYFLLKDVRLCLYAQGNASWKPSHGIRASLLCHVVIVSKSFFYLSVQRIEQPFGACTDGRDLNRRVKETLTKIVSCSSSLMIISVLVVSLFPLFVFVSYSKFVIP